MQNVSIVFKQGLSNAFASEFLVRSRIACESDCTQQQSHCNVTECVHDFLQLRVILPLNSTMKVWDCWSCLQRVNILPRYDLLSMATSCAHPRFWREGEACEKPPTDTHFPVA